MNKYHIIRHWMDGNPVNEYHFDTQEEMNQLPIIKEYTQKANFENLMWDSMYCMPSVGPHYSYYELVAKFSDGTIERICWINTIDGLDLPMRPYERPVPLVKGLSTITLIQRLNDPLGASRKKE